MKIRETFEYEVVDEETGEDIKNIEDVFTIKDYVDCVDDMCCPFWDGMIKPNIIKHDLEII
jgi:hypothetical protein